MSAIGSVVTDSASDDVEFTVPAGYTLVIGLGISGQAIARHLHRGHVEFVVADSRSTPPGIDHFREQFPDTHLYLGDLSSIDMGAAHEVVVSPGIDPNQSAFSNVRDRLVGEIELFARALPQQADVIAITGSNAKSTVTTLVGEMAAAAGIDVGVGGNLGTPALDLLADGHALYVLELSSFQLETTRCLSPHIACFLNLSEDHLDRHGDMAGYRAAKQRIFIGAQHAVVNAEDPATWPDNHLSSVSFTSQFPQEGQWGLIKDGDHLWLAYGHEKWIKTQELHIAGVHNFTNALAALAIGHLMGWSREVMLDSLRSFHGLPHRVEFVGEFQGVRFINDSKGTNVGASLAAINGIAPTVKGKLVWLGGGVGKGQDFSPLLQPLLDHARHVLLFGRDANQIADTLSGHPSIEHVNTMNDALSRAIEVALPGDAILLSPACASLDQFSNYLQRGETFRAWFNQLDDTVSSVDKER